MALVDPLVLLLFIGSLALASLCWHLGWGHRGPNPFRWKAQASFLAVVVLLIPFLGGTLVAQARAQERLRALGVEPHPELRHVVGWAMGIGSQPVWLFRAEGDPASLLEYYLNPETRTGWEVQSHAPGLGVFLEREGQQLRITARREARGASMTYHHVP